MLQMREVAMDATVKTVAVVRDAPSDAVQALFHDLIEDWRNSARIAGVLAESHGLEDRHCNAGFLRSIRDGRRYSIFQDLGPGSQACHLDGRGAGEASEAVRRDIAAGCDLVVLSKFGKLEAAREGLMPAFVAAIEAGVPVLTSVSPAFREACDRFAEPLVVALPAERAAIDAWWRSVRDTAPSPASA
jgi:hypothetical protein